MHPQADYKIRNNAKKYLELKKCRFSFSTNEEICEDINECADVDSCDLESSDCINLDGSFHCECKHGFDCTQGNY